MLLNITKHIIFNETTYLSFHIIYTSVLTSVVHKINKVSKSFYLNFIFHLAIKIGIDVCQRVCHFFI